MEVVIVGEVGCSGQGERCHLVGGGKGLLEENGERAQQAGRS